MKVKNVHQNFKSLYGMSVNRYTTFFLYLLTISLSFCLIFQSNDSSQRNRHFQLLFITCQKERKKLFSKNSISKKFFPLFCEKVQEKSAFDLLFSIFCSLLTTLSERSKETSLVHFQDYGSSWKGLSVVPFKSHRLRIHLSFIRR